MSFLLVSCDNRQTKSLLQDVETYIQERPDSALRVLRKVDSLTLNTKSLRARYSLLFAMALDKNYIDTTALSILEPTVAYYERLGSPQDKMLSCYYLGRIYANRKDYPNAVIFYYRLCGNRVLMTIIIKDWRMKPSQMRTVHLSILRKN